MEIDFNLFITGKKESKMALKKTKKSVLAASESSKSVLEMEKPVKEIKKTSEPAKRTAAVKIKKAAAKKDSFDPNLYVIIDHPKENEVVSGLHYAIRIGASSQGSVEISFDNGEWLPCRNAGGYWWFDWGYFTSGIHKIAARMRDEEGNMILKSDAIKCEVI